MSDLLGSGAAMIDNAAAARRRDPDAGLPVAATRGGDRGPGERADRRSGRDGPGAELPVGRGGAPGRGGPARAHLEHRRRARRSRAETLRAAASLEAAAVVLQAAVPGVIERFAVAGIDAPVRRRRGRAVASGRVPRRLRPVPPIGRRVTRPWRARAGELAAAWLALAATSRVRCSRGQPRGPRRRGPARRLSRTTLRGGRSPTSSESGRKHVDPVWDTLVASGNATLERRADRGRRAPDSRWWSGLAESRSRSARSTIVVSPAPSSTTCSCSRLVRNAIAGQPANRDAATEWENEPWGGNLRALHRLLERAQPRWSRS